MRRLAVAASLMLLSGACSLPEPQPAPSAATAAGEPTVADDVLFTVLGAAGVDPLVALRCG